MRSIMGRCVEARQTNSNENPARRDSRAQPQDTTPMKYHWTDGSEFRMSKFLQIKLHLACVIRGAHIGFHIVGILRTIFASRPASTTDSRLNFTGRAVNTAQLAIDPAKAESRSSVA
jgi:hypothetical protein